MSVKPKLICPLSGDVVFSDTWHQFFPQLDQLWLNGHINFGLTKIDRNDLSKTNSKLKVSETLETYLSKTKSKLK